jgi:hypothetical protein
MSEREEFITWVQTVLRDANSPSTTVTPGHVVSSGHGATR